jgi:hypothetical protein
MERQNRQNLDYGACQLTTLMAYLLHDHMALFSLATLTGGGKDTEFRSILDYQRTLGI